MMSRHTPSLFLWLSVCLAAIALAGCMTSGRKIDPASIEHIEANQTTLQEVHALLGSPDNMARDTNGNVTYTYMYFRSSPHAQNFIPIVGGVAGGYDQESQMVTVTFGADGVVTNVMATMGATDSGWGASAGGRPDVAEVSGDKRSR